MADTPEAFDVIVMPNLYGDILSDVAAQIAGSVGLAGSSNIGEHCAMFEAIHGSAPRRAGQNLANPSGLLLGAVLMLIHIGQNDIAELVHNAWLRTIEDGVHTYDIYSEGISKQKVGTKEFAEAVAQRVGQKPETLPSKDYTSVKAPAEAKTASFVTSTTKLDGVDVYVEWEARTPNDLAAQLQKANGDGLALQMMSNRGVKVWPDGFPETFNTDSFRCRFIGEGATGEKVLDLQRRILATGVEIVKTEYLRTFNGERGYSLAQGQ
jgi:isocitrate dehydrogenase